MKPKPTPFSAKMRAKNNIEAEKKKTEYVNQNVLSGDYE